jgi:apolipoprotein N-acyltransferase
MKAETQKRSFRAFFISIVFLISGSICYWLSFPPYGFPLGCLVPLFWMLGIRGMSSRWRSYGMFLAAFLAMSLGIFWFWGMFRLSSVLFWGILSFYIGLWGFLTGIPVKCPTWIKLILPAILWCGIEYFRSELAPLRFSWLSLGYSQQNAIGYFLASLIGVYGISFVMVLWASLVLYSLNIHGKGKIAAILILACIPFLTMIPAGKWSGKSLGTARLQQFRVRDSPGEFKYENESEKDLPDLIIWPEYCSSRNPYNPENSWFLNNMHEAAKHCTRAFIFGAVALKEEDRRLFINTAYILSPDGDVLGKAGKNQPIQVMADGIPAKDVTVMTIPGANHPENPENPIRFGIGVCYDGTYQCFSRIMAKRKADVLIFPSFNCESWGKIQYSQFRDIFRMRAAETKRAVLVSAFSGPTFYACPNGSTGKCLEFETTGYLDISIPSPGRKTLFVMLGWIIGPVCFFGTILFIIWEVIISLKSRIYGKEF